MTAFYSVSAVALWNEISTLWHIWWSGEPTSKLDVGWFRVYVWVRIGKLLQLLGGGTVILDLYGPDRLDRKVREAKFVRSTLRAKIDLEIFTFGLRYENEIVQVEKWKRAAYPLGNNLSQVVTAAILLPALEVIVLFSGAVIWIALIFSIALIARARSIIILTSYVAFQTLRVAVEAPFARLLHRQGYRIRVIAVTAIICGFTLDISGS